MSSSKLLPRRTLRLNCKSAMQVQTRLLRDSRPLDLYHHSMSAEMRGKDDVDIVELFGRGGVMRCSRLIISCQFR